MLDRVAIVDSKLVSEIHAQIQTVATRCVFDQWATSYRQCFDTVWLVCACAFWYFWLFDMCIHKLFNV